MNNETLSKKKRKKIFNSDIRRRFLRFSLVSLVGLALNEFIVLLVLVILDAITEKKLLFTLWTVKIEKILVATSVAIVIVMGYNFILNKIWTFKEKEEGVEVNAATQFIKFSIVGGSGTVINLGIVYLLATIMNSNEYVATTIGFVLSVINNYVFNEIWTFAGKDKTIEEQEKC